MADISGKVTGVWNIDTNSWMPPPTGMPAIYKSIPRGGGTKVQRFGDAIYQVATKPDGSTSITKMMDIPVRVKDKNEYANFADDYVSKHPGAGGMEIDTAYERFKTGVAAERTTATGTAKVNLPAKPQAMIDAEMTRGLASYNAQANADKTGANFISKMRGLKLPNSHSYAAMSAARKLEANKILPPDIPAGSAFTGRLDDKGRPLYKTPIPGAFAASDAFGGG
jgi:hypothetical protein